MRLISSLVLPTPHILTLFRGEATYYVSPETWPRWVMEFNRAENALPLLLCERIQINFPEAGHDSCDFLEDLKGSACQGYTVVHGLRSLLGKAP